MVEKVFLLGGHDLEMITIGEILQEQDQLFFDRNLQWNEANLDVYSEELSIYADQEKYHIYGIELHSGCMKTIPSNYTLIDHHNEYQDKKAALIQVLEILDLPINREHLLIAANDTGYIPEMLKLGASENEIQYIRLKDRRLQGVTEKDEILASEAVKDCVWMGGVQVVRSFSSKFAPICDRLWPFKSLLIYNVDTLCYYGDKKDKVLLLFKEICPAGTFYYGGGLHGFVGLIGGKWEKRDILKIKDEILSVISKDDTI